MHESNFPGNPAQRRSLRTRWETFATWCNQQGYQALPADESTVLAFFKARRVAGEVGCRPYLRAIEAAHGASGLGSPLVDLAQAQKTLQSALAPPLQAEEAERVPTPTLASVEGVESLGPAGSGSGRSPWFRKGRSSWGRRVEEKRNLALRNLANATELAAVFLAGLELEHVSWDMEGFSLAVPGFSEMVYVRRGRGPTCSDRALRQWLAVSGITRGPLFPRISPKGDVLGRMNAESVEAVLADA